MGISISIGISPRESLADWSRFTGELEDARRRGAVADRLAAGDEGRLHRARARRASRPSACASAPASATSSPATRR